MKSQIKGVLILLTAALIWGCAFVAQSTAAEHVGPFTVLALRFLLGGAALLPLLHFMTRLKGRRPSVGGTRGDLLGGAVCGIILCVAAVLQQAGLSTTDPGKGGFITSMYILGVPLIGLFMGRRVPVRVWLCIGAGVAGLYMLCMEGGLTPAAGDLMIILSAVAFSFHIVAVDHFVARMDGLRLACLQYLISGAVAAVPALIFERGGFGYIPQAIPAILYLGLMSTGVAYTLQIIGQRFCAPAVASLAMSFESVFAVLGEMVVFGLIMGRDVSMSAWEIVGCVVMFAAVTVSALPERRRRSSAF